MGPLAHSDHDQGPHQGMLSDTLHLWAALIIVPLALPRSVDEAHDPTLIGGVGLASSLTDHDQ